MNSDIGEGFQYVGARFSYPNVPIEGRDRAEFVRRRYAEADPGRVPRRIDEEARQEGLNFNYRAIEKLPNTLLAHRLLEFAEAQGVAHELAEVLFAGYFCNGEDLGDLITLTRLAAGVGLDAAEVEAALISDFAADEVAMQLQRATEVGVSGVPGYLLGGDCCRVHRASTPCSRSLPGRRCGSGKTTSPL